MYDRQQLTRASNSGELERTPTPVGVIEFPNEPSDSGSYRYAHYVDQPGAVIDLTGRGMKGYVGREEEALDLSNPNSQVGLACKDYDGNKYFFVLFGGGEDLAYRQYEDGVTGQVTKGILELDGFAQALMSSPLIVGARHSRLNDMKLMAVLADLQNSPAPGGPELVGRSQKAHNPLAVANDYYMDYLSSHPDKR